MVFGAWTKYDCLEFKLPKKSWIQILSGIIASCKGYYRIWIEWDICNSLIHLINFYQDLHVPGRYLSTGNGGNLVIIEMPTCAHTHTQYSHHKISFWHLGKYWCFRSTVWPEAPAEVACFCFSYPISLFTIPSSLIWCCHCVRRGLDVGREVERHMCIWCKTFVCTTEPLI